MNIIAYLAANPLVFHGLIMLASFLILIKSADMLVFGIDSYAKRLGLSDYLIGLLVVSLTASTPEFVSAITGLFAGDEGIVFGTILGSNITGITLVLGIFALIGRKIKLVNKVLTRMEVLLFFLIMLPFFLGADGQLSRIDGIALILAYLGYVTMLWVKESKSGKVKKDVKVKFIWKSALTFLLALVALFLSSRWLVFSSIAASKILHIPSYLMAIVVLGIASSLPDLFVGIRALLKGEVGVGIGNSLGSMVVKALLFFGLFALITPLKVDFGLLAVSIAFTILSLGIVMYLSEKKEMDWRHGLLLLMIYFVYIIVEVFSI
jgi:cation:H+ antiporter